MPSANNKKTRDALRPERARWREIDEERDLRAETGLDSTKGSKGLDKNPAGRGTQGMNREREDRERREEIR